MEKKQVIKRKHNLPDSELYGKAIQLVELFRKYQVHFESIGYTLDDARRLHQEAERLKNLPQDDEYLGQQMILTEKKQLAMRNLLAAIRECMNQVARAYASTSGQYRRFGTYRLGDKSDVALLFTASNVIRIAKIYMNHLKEKGFDERLLDRIQQRSQELRQAMVVQLDGISERDIAAERRIEQSNSLYECVFNICQLGQSIFRGKRSIYEHFLIYESNAEQKRNAKEKGELNMTED